MGRPVPSASLVLRPAEENALRENMSLALAAAVASRLNTLQPAPSSAGERSGTAQDTGVRPSAPAVAARPLMDQGANSLPAGSNGETRPPGIVPARGVQGGSAKLASEGVASGARRPELSEIPRAAVPASLPAAPVTPASVCSEASAFIHGVGAQKAAASSKPPAPGGHTMDDAVSELLRPLLRQWLDENMPRIVEAALKGENAEGGRTRDKKKGAG